MAATLRDLRLVDTAGERLVFRAPLADDGDGAVLVAGTMTSKSFLATLPRRPTTRRTVAARSGSTKPSRRSRTSSIRPEAHRTSRTRCHDTGVVGDHRAPRRSSLGDTLHLTVGLKARFWAAVGRQEPHLGN